MPFYIALIRNGGCDFETLREVPPPYGGEIIPQESILIEQRNWFQLTKIVDVFDPNDHNKHIGYFYDMNFLCFMRFGFSDAHDRIWFEAKYPSFFSRFKFSLEYSLERCDVGVGARHGAIYDIQEDWWQKSWFCFTSCRRVFHLTRQAVEGGAAGHVADVYFDSQLTKTGLVSWRHLWFMNMTDVTDGSTVAYAQQHNYWGGPTGFTQLSNWSVDAITLIVPNWVVGFMAALDDIEEEKEK